MILQRLQKKYLKENTSRQASVLEEQSRFRGNRGTEQISAVIEEQSRFSRKSRKRDFRGNRGTEQIFAVIEEPDANIIRFFLFCFWNVYVNPSHRPTRVYVNSSKYHRVFASGSQYKVTNNHIRSTMNTPKRVNIFYSKFRQSCNPHHQE